MYDVETHHGARPRDRAAVRAWRVRRRADPQHRNSGSALFRVASLTPDSKPHIAVGNKYDKLLKSERSVDILKVRDKIKADSKSVSPMSMMVLAIRLYDVGLRDEAVFWYYAAEDHCLEPTKVIDLQASGLDKADQAMRGFTAALSPIIKGYAFCDLAKQQVQRQKALEWTENNPYGTVLAERFTARPGDRAANLQLAIADVKRNAAEERAYFANARKRRAFYAKRKRHQDDVKYCWK
jgi:hypothetical protein